MVKHNNVLPNGHFHKDWQSYVKTWFNQPGSKKSRRIARVKKAARIAPRPMDKLAPVVVCPTLKYNTRIRAGRGFTLEELKGAGISSKVALTIGIKVDHRRKNRSVESLEKNVLRLKEYQSKLIVFPKANKVKKGDSTKEVTKTATQFKGDLNAIAQPIIVQESRKVTNSKIGAYVTLRKLRVDEKYAGIRAKRAKDLAEEEANKKK